MCEVSNRFTCGSLLPEHALRYRFKEHGNRRTGIPRPAELRGNFSDALVVSNEVFNFSEFGVIILVKPPHLGKPTITN